MEKLRDYLTIKGWKEDASKTCQHAKDIAKISLIALVGVLPACSQDVTAPEIKEKINPTEFVFDYFSSKERFPSVDSVKTIGEDVSVYGDFIDPYNTTVTDSTYSNGEIVRVTKTTTPRVDHINIDIGEIDVNDGEPTFKLGKLTPYKEYLDVFYEIFSRRHDGPDASEYADYYWDPVESNLNRQYPSSPINFPWPVVIKKG